MLSLLFLSLLFSPLLSSSEVFQVGLSFLRRHPEFEAVAPCPCDLEKGNWDTRCCCDQDCPPSARNGSDTDCLRGPLGGRSPANALPGPNCTTLFGDGASGLFPDADNPAAAIAQMFLCLAGEFSPYLGHFYIEKHLLSTSLLYDEELKRIGIRQKEERAKDKNGTLISSAIEATAAGALDDQGHFHNKEGATIKTVVDFENGIFGTVHLPAASGPSGSTCLPSPLRHLRPFSSSCSHLLDKNTCSEAPEGFLDHSSYLTSDRERVLRDVGASEATPTKVRMFSSGAPYKYVSVGGVRKSSLRWDVDSEDTALAFINRGRPDVRRISGRRYSGQFEPVISDQNLTFLGSTADSVLLDGSTCRNLVLEVSYTFFWQGTEIKSLDVDVLLGDIPLLNQKELPRRSVRQFFTAKFVHLFESEDDEQPKVKSGEPGYIPGRPLVSGQLVKKRDEKVFAHEELGLSSWQPSATSLCRDSGSRPLDFGVDLRAECLLQLSRQNFSDCSSLRKVILRIQKSLLSAKYVAKGGGDFKTGENGTDYVKIIHEVFEYQRDEVKMEEEEDVVLPEVLVPNESNETDTKEKIYHHMIGVDFCQVPSTFRVRVLYTRSHAHNSVTPILRVVGVRVTPLPSRWAWHCVEKTSKHCADVQNYPLTQSVRFEEIPLEWHHRNTSKFWIREEESGCAREQCWAQMFYPVTHWGMGGDGERRAYVALWSILVGLGGAGVLVWTSSYW